MSFLWAEDEIIRVGELLGKGYSAGQIAPHLGVTRNAIIGIVGRNEKLKAIGFKRPPGGGWRKNMSMTARPTQELPAAPPKPSVPKYMLPKQGRPKSTPTVAQPARKDALSSVGLPMLALGAFQCRYEVNDAEPGEHLFCGSAATGPWCDHHRRIVFMSSKQEGQNR